MSATNYHHHLLSTLCLASTLSFAAFAAAGGVGNNTPRANAWALNDASVWGISSDWHVDENEEAERLKDLALSVLRGGHDDDVTHHYTGPPPPPPPPPNYDGNNNFSNTIESPDNINQANDFPSYQATCDTVQYSPSPTAPHDACLFPQGTWERYLRATNNDITEARRRLASTLQWRIQNGMDRILSNPHPNFHVLKQYYPHAYHLRGINGEPVYYECPSKIDLPALKSAGLTLDHLLHHYALVTEFMWTHISPHQEGPSSRGITVIDLDGMRLRDFAGEVVTFVKRAASFTGEHYPERSGTIYILNAPSFFQLIWRAVKPLVDPVTLAKVKVVDSNNKKDPYAIRNSLMESIPIENIPREYGGLSDVPLGFAPEEEWLKELMQQNNQPPGQQYQQQPQETGQYYNHDNDTNNN